MPEDIHPAAIPSITLPEFTFPGLGKKKARPRRRKEEKLEIPESWLRGSVGMKYDAGKLGYDLVDDAAEAEFVAVLTYGAVKYEPDNWAKVDDAERRYFAAARRHMAADRRGEIFDEEHGLLALAGAICDLHFLLALRIRKNPELAKSLPARLKKALEVARKFRDEREMKKREAEREFAAMIRGEKPEPGQPGSIEFPDRSGGLGSIERRERALAERRKKTRRASGRKKN